jgi:L-threonylcarbamoyladenylate synthase
MRAYSSQQLRQVKHHLNKGGVVAYPTESCYGFGCDPYNYRAINKVIRLKERAQTKGLIVIAGRIAQIKPLIQPLSTADKQTILAKYWPGFYSLLMPITHKVLPNLRGQHSKLAVRVSRHTLVQQLCNFLNIPLVSTSANKSGHISIKSYRECQRLFGKQVMVLPGLTNFAKKPSKIMDWQTKQILR